MSRKHHSSLPGFEPIINRDAGPAASGVRVGFPASRTVTLNYCETTTVVGTSGAIGKHIIRLNSAYDPDQTLSGHQPMAFDQWSLFYNHYVVEETTFDVEIGPKANDSAAGGYNSWVGCHISDDATTPVVVSELMELGSQTALTNPYSNGSTHIFKGVVNMAKYLNRKDIASDPEVRAAVNANPTEQVILTIWGVNTDGLSTTTFNVGFKLAMRIRFMEPKDLAPSLKVPRPVPAPADEFVLVRRAGASTLKMPPI